MFAMDESFISFPMICSFLLLLLLAVRITRRNTSSPKLPPDPWKFPIVGDIHRFIGHHPHIRLKQLADRHVPVMHLQLGEISTVVISSAEMAREVMKIHDLNFANRPATLLSSYFLYGQKDIAFAPYGDYWREMRKICTHELLRAKRVQSFWSIMNQETTKMVEELESNNGSVVNLSKMIYSALTTFTINAAFRGKCNEQEEFLVLSRKIVFLLTGFRLVDVFPSLKFLHYVGGSKNKAEKLHKECDRILENVINAHRSESDKRKSDGDVQEPEDFVNVLLKIQEKDGLPFPMANENIKAIILDVFLAGSEPSATLIEWAISELIRHPETIKKAQAEIRQVFYSKGQIDESGIQELKYLQLIIKETLRTHPPGPLLLPRESMNDGEINGYHIPAKTKVIVNAWAIARDPWTDPESFKPERFMERDVDFKGTSFELIPFGAGRRICAGMGLGLATTEIVLANLLYHFNWVIPDGGKPEVLDMTILDGASCKRLNGLKLIPVRYNRPIKTTPSLLRFSNNLFAQSNLRCNPPINNTLQCMLQTLFTCKSDIIFQRVIMYPLPTELQLLLFG